MLWTGGPAICRRGLGPVNPAVAACQAQTGQLFSQPPPVPAWKDSNLTCPVPRASWGPGTPTHPGTSLAHPEGQEAWAGLRTSPAAGREQGPAPALEPWGLQVGLVCFKAQVEVAEETPRRQPQRPQAGSPSPHPSAPTQCSFERH